MGALVRYLIWAGVLLTLALAPATRVAAGDPAHSRRTPIVEAVARTQGAICTLRVEKKSTFGKNGDVVGTAVVIAERGYAITNNHVIASALKINATLADGTPLTVRVMEQLPQYDLAILQLDPTRTYKTIVLGPSSDLMVGEEVIAIGSPYGYSNTVSRGIVSALGRSIPLPSGDEQLTGLIQTDAPINPGSSGGALINVNGELIGINVAIRDGAQGIAFAIPSDTVKHVLAKCLSAKKISGIDHGLRIKEKVVAETGARQKVIVAEIIYKTMAQAGILPGDEIVQVAGRGVTNAFEVERALWDSKPGSAVSLRLVGHDGQVKEAVLQLPEPTGPVASRP